MFGKILVANRGEIALRIIRTCREMGISTVAVYSDVDYPAPHVRAADQAVRIGPAEPARSYLDQEAIIAAARRTGADAVHPGYGFLAENASFARACAAAGIAFIGPSPQAMATLGNKTTARTVMERAGIPFVPGMCTGSTDAAAIAAAAARLGFPVLIKAAAGGGGKGMRVAADDTDIRELCDAAMHEARRAFGDGTIYLERLIEQPRHVEFQVLADHYGRVIHLGERECSIQRRYQKIIEETPSPALTPALRQRMGEAAVAAAEAAGYTNAGTVEFLLDRDGQFYFLEMNTRLQVEHPVTEMVTGIDLVRRQILIAAGEPLGLRQEDIRPRGHAFECRIYAEDPSRDFLPCSGPLRVHREPSGPGVRNDCGVCEGGIVPLEYDPIISKLVAFGEDRETARRRLLRALREYVILGVQTTISFLLDVLDHPAFVAGETGTDFIPRHFSLWSPPAGGSFPPAVIAAYLAALQRQEPSGNVPPAGPAVRPPSPWQLLGNWKM